MKKTIFAVVIIAVLCTLLCLAGCGGKNSEPDPNAGLYKAVSAEMFGVEMSAEEALDGSEFTIELMNGGKAKFNYDGKSYSMKWTLDGTTFNAKGGGAELNGTLSGGVLQIKNMMDMGVNVKLVNEELAAAAPAEEPAESEEAPEEEEENILMNGTRIFFQNTLETEIQGLYISNGDTWGDPVNDEDIPAGGNTILDISVLSDGPGTYDVGIIDENGRNYDIYDVELDGRRLVAVSAVDDTAYIVLIDKNGETQTFEGTAYDSDEE